MLRLRRPFSTLNTIQKVMKMQNPDDVAAQTEMKQHADNTAQKEFERDFSHGIVEENRYFQKYIMSTPQFKKLYNSNPLSYSMRLTAGLNVGTLGLTADEESAKQLIELRKAAHGISADELIDLEFFDNYFTKMKAIRENDTESYDKIQAVIIQQAESGCLFARFHIAQEFFEAYNLYLKSQNKLKYVDNQLKVVNTAFTRAEINKILQYLLDFAAINPADSSYMIAELASQLANDVVSKSEALKFYMLAASHNEPQSCYHLSL